jgi:ABC-type Na+ transport system ATPase subunit NatA
MSDGLMIEICNLNRPYIGNTAVSNSSLPARRGEITGLPGSNGDGKNALFFPFLRLRLVESRRCK